MEEGVVDLDRLGLRSGQLESVRLTLHPAAPTIGGEPLGVEDGRVETRVDVSRTTSGFALRLRADPLISGRCARCLEPAEVRLRIDLREVSQPDAIDAELTSPYVVEATLDVGAWLFDAITLALPEKVLCRSDCAGICEECGARLNDFAPGEHSHPKPPDPRFAKLRELTPEDD